jgi:Leucine-rich repeat (LRR) protein
VLLAHNRIAVLPSGAFIYLKRLKHLAIAYNKFSELPSSFLRGPTNLEQLELDGNQLDQTGQINNLFNDVPDLKRLELNFCSLDDQKVGQLQLNKVPLILRLGLGGNNLTEVPSSTFRALPHLQTIDLRHNKIQRIQPCAFCACNITTVLLGHNLIGVKPKSINTEAFADVFIREIDLSYNFFNDFESRLLGYAEISVETLDLSGNDLPTLKPVYTLTLPSLLRLHMADNKFGELPPVLPPEYNRLEFLNLSRNELKYLPDNIDGYLSGLRSLDLSNNLFE